MKINKTRLIAVVLALFSIVLLSFSCEPHQVSYFPVQKEPQQQFLLTRMEGKLFIDNHGYLRLKADGNSPPLIIWPYGYSWKNEDNKIWIINNKGKAIWRVGDTVVLGDGFTDASDMELKTGQPLPAEAVGPYFESNPQ